MKEGIHCVSVCAPFGYAFSIELLIRLLSIVKHVNYFMFQNRFDQINELTKWQNNSKSDKFL